MNQPRDDVRVFQVKVIKLPENVRRNNRGEVAPTALCTFCFARPPFSWRTRTLRWKSAAVRCESSFHRLEKLFYPEKYTWTSTRLTFPLPLLTLLKDVIVHHDVLSKTQLYTSCWRIIRQLSRLNESRALV